MTCTRLAGEHVLNSHHANCAAYHASQDFEHIVNTLVKWTREYKARTGFDGPGAFITYFVNRNGRKKWPLLNYGGDSGEAAAAAARCCCMLDAS